jgi:hypothetical protein
VWLRRALFQVHLWTGIALGLYVVMLSITGSALVYRNEMDRFFATPKPTFDPNGKRLSKDELQAIAEKLYPGYTITHVGDRVTGPSTAATRKSGCSIPTPVPIWATPSRRASTSSCGSRVCTTSCCSIVPAATGTGR